ELIRNDAQSRSVQEAPRGSERKRQPWESNNRRNAVLDRKHRKRRALVMLMQRFRRVHGRPAPLATTDQIGLQIRSWRCLRVDPNRTTTLIKVSRHSSHARSPQSVLNGADPARVFWQCW